MATMYTWDPITGTYVLSDTGTYILSADGTYVQSFSVTTDQLDYSPLSTATFTVSGVTAGDTLTFDVTDLFGNPVSGTDQPWTLTASADGTLQTTWAVGADAAGQAFLLTVVDQTTGQITTAEFTDSVHFTPVDAVAPDGTNGMVITTAGAESTGTGIFPSFVEINSPANSTTESGFNPADPPIDNTGSSANFNHPIQVKNLDIETDSTTGQQYYVFRLDLNEPNNGTAGTAILQQLKLFYDSTGTALPDGSGQPTAANLLYDMDGGVNGDISITLADWSAGSGHGDYIFKIPVNVNLDPNTYIYLYSTFTDATGGFEEWALGPNANPPPPQPDAVLSLDKETLCADDKTNINLGNGLVNVNAESKIIWEYTIQNVQSGTSAINMQLYDDKILGGTFIYDHTNSAWAGTHYINPDLASVTFTDNGVANTAVLDSGILAFGDTWVFDVSGTPVAGTYSNHNITAYQNTGTATGDDSVHTSDVLQAQWLSSYTGVDPEFALGKLTNGASNPNVISGQVIKWTYTVHNTGNVDLTDLVLTDDNGGGASFHPSQVLVTYLGNSYNDGDVNHDGLLNPGETWDFTASGIATATTYTNVVTVDADSDIGGFVVLNDGCGESLSIEGTATSGYTGLAPTVAGLTKGFWATHLTLWDVYSGDEKGAGAELNPFYGDDLYGTVGALNHTINKITPVSNPFSDHIDWNKDGVVDNSTLTASGPSSNIGLVSGSNNGGGDYGLLLGDLNHNGLVDDSTHIDPGPDHTLGTIDDIVVKDDLFLDLASAQALANSSVSGDARIILASQLVAAQLNEYNAYVFDTGLGVAHGGLAPGNAGTTVAPNGLIQEAVQWLNGTGLLSNGDSKINFSTTNDVAGITTIINDGTPSTNDYTLSGGAITFKSTSMSSSDASWQHYANVLAGFTPGTDSAGNPITNGSDVNGAFNTVAADGEGLKNALAAYNHGGTGTAGFVISTDGSLIGWQDSLGGPVYDVHANTVDAFWGILENQNLLGHTIVGITGVHVV